METQLTARAAESLRGKANRAQTITATVGLDAFVDEIVRVVDKRMSQTDYTAIEQIEKLGSRIVEAAGRSTNLELVVERVKLGGNGPIMANAMAALGTSVTCMGPLGEPVLHPAFAEIASRARVVSVGNPAHTDALEFGDGKLMFGKLQPLNDVNWIRLLERVGADELMRLFTDADLVCLVNWTMIPAMSSIFEKILELVKNAPARRGVYFFDLADPKKHDPGKIARACRLLARFHQYRHTVLGLNEQEAFLVGRALGYAGGDRTREDVVAVAEFVSGELPIGSVVVHPRAYAVAACQGHRTAEVDGPFTATPLISTGAGDHFNAGFCLGKLLGLPDDESAAIAVGTSGYYVRTGASPNIDQLAGFLEQQAKDSSGRAG